MPIRSITPRSPKRPSAAFHAASLTCLVSCSDLQNSYTAASSACIAAGRRPSAIASAISGARPAFSASLRCAYHSYYAPQWRAVTRIASSARRAGSELSKRT